VQLLSFTVPIENNNDTQEKITICCSLHMIISIIGIPASGKSSLLKSIMQSLGEPERIKLGKFLPEKPIDEFSQNQTRNNNR